MTSRDRFPGEKYLRRHAPETIPGLEKFSRIAVIPAWDELKMLPATLDALRDAAKPCPVATLVVVNFPARCDAAESNATVAYLQHRQQQQRDLFFLYRPGLAGGVGAARKCGMDSFLAARRNADWRHDWIFSLDADTAVAPDYFTRIEQAIAENPAVGAWTLPFLHRAEDPVQEKAVRRYEAYLARYVEKLSAARSPYAISTVGSAFCVSLFAYLKAGGMKIKAAGEDFYFLSELVKTGRVGTLGGEALVYPSGRISGRTPFGTGKAIAKLLAGDSLNEIPDAAFDELAALLKTLDDPALREAPQSWVAALPESAQKFLAQEKFLPLWEKVLENTPRDPDAVKSAFHRWFDGLKTLRYLHFARSMRGSAAI